MGSRGVRDRLLDLDAFSRCYLVLSLFSSWRLLFESCRGFYSLPPYTRVWRMSSLGILISYPFEMYSRSVLNKNWLAYTFLQLISFLPFFLLLKLLEVLDVLEWRLQSDLLVYPLWMIAWIIWLDMKSIDGSNTACSLQFLALVYDLDQNQLNWVFDFSVFPLVSFYVVSFWSNSLMRIH